MTKIVASVHDTYIPFVEDVYLIENPATCIKLGKKKEKKKRKLSCHYRCNQAGITEDIPTGK